MTDREFVHYWLAVSVFWREAQHAPTVMAAEEKQWADDEEARMRARRILLEADVAMVALQLAAEPDKPLSVGRLSRLIAEDRTQSAIDRARKRVVNRIVETMEQYRLIHVETIRGTRTTQYEITPTGELLSLFQWLRPRFPAPPDTSSRGHKP